ncbi:23S rRNA methyltransferase [Mergibacter septicus]|uniref:23S rRNA (uracil(1939)-C(5))-methyltransferase RlmD n=1 Tax=Mergibacter septicus TaxID=221402 RepID=A0A8E3SC68_9PAST|nr:23S rRNA (uracil(1939)-C(5))-methyltransferase RlmD [Mergibacter septicus]AWX15947.1 23S rRNA methyltransferase [Mergibacter septicus]QDJ15200.1 23S rRNA methyltransferase [Mergibacter septicus]UTU47379.1 23S rRNA (uracil(1939)-C(5))-methyltransferase RlmD [Mergibacter septicus]WMR95441.1 23S rRNA (uracil(1939)-C(5))-methyltransferase RlmD [Mergibacter septicus]
MVLLYNQPKKIQPKQRYFTLNIESLDYQGFGLARQGNKQGGKCWFIDNALPNEVVEIEVLEEKARYGRGKVVRYLQQSSQRREPKCQHYHLCGGCQMQHVDLALQRSTKQQALLYPLGRLTKTFTEKPMLSGNEWHYRRRLRLSAVVGKKSGKLTLGLRQRGSNQIVSLTQCPVLETRLEQLLQPLQQLVRHWQRVKQFGHIELVLAENGVVMLLRHQGKVSDADRQALLAFAHQYQLILFVQEQEETIEQWLGEQPYYRLNNLKLYFDVRDFIQVNALLNQKMVEQALTWLDLSPQDRVLDLFCGMGNFTLPLAQQVESVVGVEGVMAMVEKAKRNAKLNQIDNATFYQADLSQPFKGQVWAELAFNKVLLDPPRSGAAFVLPHICALQPEKILYVSCNPATLIRDTEILLQNGYHLIQTAMIDMFPQTGHLESINLFSK